MTDRQRIIRIAQQRCVESAEIRFVLDIARQTDDRHLLAVCLDCFRTVLRDRQDEATIEVVRFLGDLLRDRTYRRIRRRVLLTATWIGAASGTILPDIMAVYRRPGSHCVWKTVCVAALCIAWCVLVNGDGPQRAVALNTYEQFNSLGVLNLRAFLNSDECRPDLRPEVESTIARLAARYPDARVQ